VGDFHFPWVGEFYFPCPGEKCFPHQGEISLPFTQAQQMWRSPSAADLSGARSGYAMLYAVGSAFIETGCRSHGWLRQYTKKLSYLIIIAVLVFIIF